MFAKDLVFDNNIGDCPICLEERNAFVGHPAECGHRVCVPCFKELASPKFPEPNIRACDFGWKPMCDCAFCRDGNPCSDEMSRWQRESPENAEAFNDAENEQCDHIEQFMEERASLMEMCPLCRTEIRNAPSNSWKMP